MREHLAERLEVDGPFFYVNIAGLIRATSIAIPRRLICRVISTLSHWVDVSAFSCLISG